jgi:hypothetical protein
LDWKKGKRRVKKDSRMMPTDQTSRAFRMSACDYKVCDTYRWFGPGISAGPPARESPGCQLDWP